MNDVGPLVVIVKVGVGVNVGVAVGPLVVIVNVGVACLGFGQPASLLTLSIAVPVVLTISMIPISIGGLGLLEWAYFTVFSQLGLPGALGFSIALLARARAMAIGSLGGAFYARTAVDRDRPAPASQEQPDP